MGGTAEAEPGAWPGGEASPEGSPGGRRGAGVRAVRLRVEYVSNLEAELLSWTVFTVTLVMFAIIVASSVAKFLVQPGPVLFNSDTWYICHVAVTAAMLAGLLCLAALFARNVWLATRDGRVWNRRLRALARDAGGMLGIQVAMLATSMGAYAWVLAHPCYWFGDGIAYLAALRWSLLNCQLAWMLVMAHGMTRHRGAPAGAEADDALLVLDAPPRAQAALHAPKAVLWALFEAVVVVKTANWLSVDDMERNSATIGCTQADIECKPSSTGVATTVTLALLTCAYAAAYLAFLRRAFRDHAALPFCHYRLSNMYIRIMAHHGPVAFFTIVATVVLLQLIHYSSCWSYIDMSMGALPIQVALAMLVAVQAVLLMPKNPGSKDLLMSWVQELSWTQRDLEAAVERRDYRLRRSQFAMSGELFAASRLRRHAQRSGGQSMFLEEALGLGLGEEGAADGGGGPQQNGRAQQPQNGQAQQAQQPDGQPRLGQSGSKGDRAAARVLAGAGASRREPMFCFELAVRLWAWAQYAYRHWWVDGGMDPAWLLGLFGLEALEALRDPRSDTRCVLAWRDGALLLAFRGTASTANAVTDVKAWMTTLQPRRYHQGLAVRVHAGFWQAYRANEETTGLAARIQQLVAGFSPDAGLNIYVTGHSLGGALAVLAASELAARYPGASLHCCTFGAPRPGNRAFAGEFRRRVPDSWALVNDQDPVTRVPATGFRGCGLRVLLNARGDLLVRPTYFERNVISRSGGNPAHHRMSRYALALAAAVKAQFSPSKALPGGAAGARALAASLDLGRTLLLSRMGLEELQDADLQPEWLGAAGLKEQPSERSGCAFAWCAVCDACDEGSSAAAACLAEEAEEGQAMVPANSGTPLVEVVAAPAAEDEEVAPQAAARDGGAPPLLPANASGAAPAAQAMRRQ